jgi:hypothetical protein
MVAEVNSDQLSLFDEISVRFLRAVKEVYGRQHAVDTLNHLQTTLGKDWLGRVMFHMMSDNYHYMEEFTLQIDPSCVNGFKKINAIKSVRALTGYGLGESKTFVEDVMDRRPRTAKMRVDHGMEQAEWERRIREELAELKASGFKAEVL